MNNHETIPWQRNNFEVLWKLRGAVGVKDLGEFIFCSVIVPGEGIGNIVNGHLRDSVPRVDGPL